jgi:large subunit ribosomal protein L21e
LPQSLGYRHDTRQLLRKRGRQVRTLTPFLREYRVGDRVVIKLDPAQHKGMPHRRYHGLVGVVEKVDRRALWVRVRVGGKTKLINARFEHVKPHKEG